MKKLDTMTMAAVKSRILELSNGSGAMPLREVYNASRGDLPAYPTLTKRGILWSDLARELGLRLRGGNVRMDDVTLEQFLAEVRRVAKKVPNGKVTMDAFDEYRRPGYPRAKSAFNRWTYKWTEVCELANVESGDLQRYEYDIDDVIDEVARIASVHGNVPRRLFDDLRPDTLPLSATICNINGIEWNEILQAANVPLTTLQRAGVQAGKTKVKHVSRKTSRPALLRAMQSGEDEANAVSERLMVVPGSARRWGNGTIVELR